MDCFSFSQRLTACVCLLLGSSAAASAFAQTPWRTDKAFEAQMAAPLPNLVWRDTPLRPALKRLSKTQSILIVLDRRVDPGQVVQFEAQGMSVERTLEALARQLDLGMCVVGPVVYFGPKATANVLATVAERKVEEAKRLPAAPRAAMIRRRAVPWPMLTTPRKVLTQVAEELGMSWVSLDAVPHDLLDEAGWPPLAAPHRLSLLLAGFNLTYQAEGERLRLAPLPRTAELTRTYTAKADKYHQIHTAAMRFDDAKVVKLAENRIRVSGPGALHRQVRRIVLGDIAPGPVKTNYTLKVERQPRGPITEALGKKLGLKVQFAPDIGADLLRQSVSFDVNQVSLEVLLEALLGSAGLRGEVAGGILTVRRK